MSIHLNITKTLKQKIIMILEKKIKVKSTTTTKLLSTVNFQN